MKRLTWLVGPPAAGKTTWVKTLDCAVVEFNEMLAPLIEPQRLRKGVLSANGHLVGAVRAVLLHAENVALPPTLVVAGMVAETILFPVSEDEDVWLLLPERARWERQLLARPVNGGATGQYDDYEYARLWYERFSSWPGRLPVVTIDAPYRQELIGGIADR
ncbi:MAG: hypothetical protein Q8N23_02210 [Archangium sp.]|nr:hypothetical protein [Archangium sp.]MDP3575346.1 hypothetical protein [Archangium sp.]